jgi:hypothetical protein
MGTVKVAILEIDGTELDVPTEMDLNDALAYVGHTNLIPEYTVDPISPQVGFIWIKSGVKVGEPIGLLLAMTSATPDYKLSYKSSEGFIVRTKLT